MDLFTEINRTKILEDLFRAYYDARKNKRDTINVLIFEKDFEANLFELCDEILERRYTPKPNICFVVERPVKREVFAADFRDRIIHHFIYNYISQILERRFINDSYSCRKGKGIHYGVKRADGFVRKCSLNYTRDCYILKLDIRGYFMSMNKHILYRKIREDLVQKAAECDFDLPLVIYLLEKTIFNDPTVACRRKGKKTDWVNIPKSKSLFYISRDCGLPIGNLTSKLLGNVYMNAFDNYVKHELNVKYYGRYVDDMIFVHEDKEYLKTVLTKAKEFLWEDARLEIHPNKIYLQHYTKGVGFIGAFIKPRRIYISDRTKGNFYEMIRIQNKIVENEPTHEQIKDFVAKMNSYLGLTRHYATYNLRRKMVFEVLSPAWWKYVYLDGRVEKFVIKQAVKAAEIKRVLGKNN